VETLHFIQGDIRLDCNASGAEQRHSICPYSADPEPIADGLNPLTIIQTPRNTSFKMIGRASTNPTPMPISKPDVDNKFNASIEVAPMRPQTDMNRGRSLD
jgi:hypothetical protein